MIYKNCSLFAFALVTSLGLYPSVSSAVEGGSVGNGGDAVVCRDATNHITSAELLDFYEARVQREIVINLGSPSVHYTTKIETALQRIAYSQPGAAAYFRYVASEFLENTRFLSGVDLVDLPDSQNIIVPRSCRIEQAAIRLHRRARVREDKTYMVNQEIWNAMDSTSRAGLVLHEIMYGLAVEKGNAQDSRKVRYLNSLIAADQLRTLFAMQVDFLLQDTFGYQGNLELSRHLGGFGDGFNYTFVRASDGVPFQVKISGWFRRMNFSYCAESDPRDPTRCKRFVNNPRNDQPIRDFDCNAPYLLDVETTTPDSDNRNLLRILVTDPQGNTVYQVTSLGFRGMNFIMAKPAALCGTSRR